MKNKRKRKPIQVKHDEASIHPAVDLYKSCSLVISLPCYICSHMPLQFPLEATFQNFATLAQTTSIDL